MMELFELVLDLQLFAEAGTLNNTTKGTVDAYAGAGATYNDPTDGHTMSPTMKVYYDTELLENSREKLIFQQIGKKFPLPANHGRTMEWRKWDTLPDAEALKEGVIPTGKALGMTYTNAEVAQYGEYVTVSDLLELHAIDDVILGATEELGAACGLTYDKLVRAQLLAGTNAIMADAYTAAGVYDSTPATRAALKTAINGGKVCYVTADMVNKAAVAMRKANVPYYSGSKYLAVIHPSCTYDLRKDKDWVDVHKYSAPEEIFNGEIGELHGVRFIESTMAPIVDDGGVKIYTTFFFGKDPFGVIDVAGGNMQTIVKSKEQVGGPLNQFSTIGAKFEMGAKILYKERVLALESSSSYAASDMANA